MKITINTDINAPCCPCEIVPEDPELESILIQTDWDFPGVASTFGWSPRFLQVSPRRECGHASTDGTVDCPDCGLKAGDFIESARQFIEDNDGAEAEDPGYFSQ